MALALRQPSPFGLSSGAEQLLSSFSAAAAASLNANERVLLFEFIAAQLRPAMIPPSQRALEATEVFASAVQEAVERHIREGRMGYRDGKLVVIRNPAK
jgi:hypothetical protein